MIIKTTIKSPQALTLTLERARNDASSFFYYVHALDAHHKLPDPVQTLEEAQIFASDLDRTLSDASRLARDFDLDLDLVFLSGHFSHERVQLLITRIDLAYAQVQAWVGTVEEEAVSGGARAAGLARWLIDRAVWAVPGADRSRYSEEWLAELWDLAEADAGFVRQVAYALRLGSRVWELRGELRAPRRRGAPS